MKNKHEPHLAVFLGSLSSIDNVGSMHQALNVYRKFAENGWNVSIYSGDAKSEVPDIGFKAKVYPQWPIAFPKKLKWLYYLLMPILHFGSGRKTDVIITIQAFGQLPALTCAKLWGAKVIARCGMVYGESAEVLNKKGRRSKNRKKIEKKTFCKADKCLIPTADLAEWVIENYKVERKKIVVAPNYVDTDIFQPAEVQKDFDIISVGRLVPKKRHDLLIRSLSDSNYKIKIIGKGVSSEEIKKIASSCKNEVTFIERVENRNLPKHFNSSKIYVNLASWEGHPKALIEAMSCRMACIGANSPGIKNLIIDGQTGLLVDPEPEQIHKAVERLLTDNSLREYLAKNAYEYAIKHFSLDNIFEIYRQTCESLISK